jgi:2,5-diketo-D-gluconate reductase A
MANRQEDDEQRSFEQLDTSLTRRAAILVAAISSMAPRQVSAASLIQKGVTIAAGVRMPVLALNTAGLSTEDTERAVGLAVKNGFQHIDFHPGIERDGVALALKKEPRARIFLTSKIKKADPTATASEAVESLRRQIDEDLEVLGIDRFDMLMLRDHPSCDVMKAQWRAMEDALASNKTRSIGVVNFCQGALSCILEIAKVKPAVNYFMLHPGMGPDAHGLRSFGEKLGVKTFAYGVLGEPGPELLGNPVLEKIASDRGTSVEDVAVRWALQSGVSVSVRPTSEFSLGSSVCQGGFGSTCEGSLARRSGAVLRALTDQQMRSIDEMTSPDGNPTLFSSAGCPGPSPLRP